MELHEFFSCFSRFRIISFAQTLVRTAISFIKNYIVPAAKRTGAEFEIAAPEIREVVSGRKKLKIFAKDVGTKTVGNHLGGGKIIQA